MPLDDLTDAVEAAYADLDDELAVGLDRETKHELAMLVAVIDADPGELVNRAVHLLYNTTADTGKLDFHLRTEFGVTYDEYLAGMTYDEMTGGSAFSAPDDDRRYQF